MSRGGRWTPAALLATLTLAVLALALAGAAVAALLGGDDDDGGPAVRSGGRTVAVTRETLVDRETVEGTLGYAGTRTVLNRLGGSGAEAGGGSGDDASGGSGSAPGDSSGSAPGEGTDSGAGAPADSGAGASGTVTALARPGSVVRRGGVLYRLDGEPVALMYGSTPAYRELAEGVPEGRDVRQLERNLAALGFDPGTVDESFTSSTATAVSDWQESAGLPETGTVELGRVVFLPGARRIGELEAEPGSLLAAGTEVLETSSTERVVTIELDASLQGLARKGDRVEVILPDQSTVRGRITEVGRVAREKDDSGSGDPATGTGDEQELVIDVTVRLRSARRLGRLDEAPVSVGLASQSRRNVLAVPVDALLARRGGGYGVELAGGRIVPVRTGLFAGGYVQVSGARIREGTRVVVPVE